MHDLVAGDPALAACAERLLVRPPIAVPTIVLHGEDDTVQPPATASGADRLLALVESRVLPRTGHNIPQECPGAVVDAVRRLAAL